MIMTVKYLTEPEKQECRPRWEEAFPEDSPSFVDYYFSEKCKDNKILAIGETEGSAFEVEAMVQGNPYLLQVGKKRWTIDYLVGIATRQERRGRGYMAMLLGKYLKDSREQQVPFTFLMPANEAIYLPFGFACIFDQPLYEWAPDALKGLTKRALLPWRNQEAYHNRAADAAVWMNAWLDERYKVHSVRNTDYLYRLLTELTSEDGTFDIYYDEDDIVGIQSEWGLSQREQRLLYANDGLITRTGEKKGAIMARLITPEKVMREITLPAGCEEEDVSIRIRITDPLIDDNNADWVWTLSELGSRVEKVLDDDPEWSVTENRADLEISIEDLTTWLFGYGVPEAAEPFARYVQPLSPVFLDEVV